MSIKLAFKWIGIISSISLIILLCFWAIIATKVHTPIFKTVYIITVVSCIVLAWFSMILLGIISEESVNPRPDWEWDYYA